MKKFILLLLLICSPAIADVSNPTEWTDGTDSVYDPWKVTFDSITDNGDGSLTVNGGGGSGDITKVGDCVTGACFDGTSGSDLTFNSTTDGVLSYSTANGFRFSQPINATQIGASSATDATFTAITVPQHYGDITFNGTNVNIASTSRIVMADDRYIGLGGTSDGRFTFDNQGTDIISINNAIFDLYDETSPTVSALGQMIVDNNQWATGHGAIHFYDGTSTTALVNVLAFDTPSNGQVPTWNTGGTITWETPSGGGGTPGGSDTQVQFNDGGSFGGNSGFTFTKTTQTVNAGTVHITGGNTSAIDATRIGATTPADATFNTLDVVFPITTVNSGTGSLGGFSLNSPIYAGTTSTSAFQSGSLGISGHVLTSNGNGSIPTFQAPPPASVAVGSYISGGNPRGVLYTDDSQNLTMTPITSGYHTGWSTDINGVPTWYTLTASRQVRLDGNQQFVSYAPTAGYIPFGDGTIYAEDSSLFWDNSNKRLGIGTATPNTILNVVYSGSGDSPTVADFQNTGGSSSDRSVSISLTPRAGSGVITARNPDGNVSGQNTELRFITNDAGTPRTALVLNTTGTVTIPQHTSATYLYTDGSGNVGAGTAPILTVAGASGDLQTNNGSGNLGSISSIGATIGGTGIDTSASTGAPKVEGGTWSVVTPVADGIYNFDCTNAGNVSSFTTDNGIITAITTC